jgi:hypothetical protein
LEKVSFSPSQSVNNFVFPHILLQGLFDGIMAPKAAAKPKAKAPKPPTDTDRLLAKTQEQLVDRDTIWLQHGQAVLGRESRMGSELGRFCVVGVLLGGGLDSDMSPAWWWVACDA